MKMKIALLILAAGFSQRMGVLKPLLPVGGTSALCRAVGLGIREKIHTISVVTGHRHEEVEAELLKCAAKNVRHVYNAHYADGMFTSVKTGVRSLPGDLDGFFLLPVDHCAVRPDTIDRLIASFIPEGGGIVYPTYRGVRGHPPLIPFSLAEGIKSYGGENGMSGYLSQFKSADTETGDPGIALDMDTPEDYTALLRHLELPAYPDEYTCFRLLEQYETPENVIRHSRQVGDAALRIADLLVRQGVRLNKPLLYAACLLHDIKRLEPGHETAGALLLLSEGYPDAARLVRRHMDLPEDAGLTSEPDYELLILYLADKLCRDGQPVHPSQTLAALEKRFAGDPEALAVARRRMADALAILGLFEKRHGVRYSDITASPQ